MPTILLRLYGYMYFIKRDPVEFYGFGKLIEIIFQGSYGSWTLVNIVKYGFLNENCKKINSYSFMNY